MSNTEQENTQEQEQTAPTQDILEEGSAFAPSEGKARKSRKREKPTLPPLPEGVELERAPDPFAEGLNRQTLEGAYESAAAALGRLGVQVSWDVDPDILVPVEELREKLARAGLPITLTMPTTEHAIAYSLKALRKLNLLSEEEPVRGQVEGVKVGGGCIVYALMERVVDSSDGVGTLGLEQRYKVAYFEGGLPEEWRAYTREPERGLVYFIGNRVDNTGEAERALWPLIARYADAYTSRLITDRICTRVVALADGIPMNRKGIFYFIPDSSREWALRLRYFLESISTPERPVEVTLYNVPKGPDDRESLGGTALRALLAELQDVRNDMRHIERRDAARGEEEVSATAVTKREKSMAEQERNIQAVLAKAERYKLLTDVNTDALAQEVQALRQYAQRLRTFDGTLTERSRGRARDEALTIAASLAPTQEPQVPEPRARRARAQDASFAAEVSEGSPEPISLPQERARRAPRP